MNLGITTFLDKRPKIKKYFPQIITLLFIIFIFGYFTYNARVNMDTRGIDFGLRFLGEESSFDISFSPFVEYDGTKSYATAYLVGLINSSGDVVGWIDSNMSSVVKKYPQMISKLDDADMVILSRYVEGGSDKRKLIRSLSSKYFNIICRFMLRLPVKDLTSGIFLMKRRVIDEVSILAYGHGDFFIEFMDSAHRKGFKIKEIPFLQFKLSYFT